MAGIQLLRLQLPYSFFLLQNSVTASGYHTTISHLHIKARESMIETELVELSSELSTEREQLSYW